MERPGGSRRLRMADVARIAGVSVPTVSRALAGSALVTAETRERVAEAVRRTGYLVNTVAANLRTQRSRQVLALVPSIANPFFGEVLLGLEEALGEGGFSLLVGNTGQSSGGSFGPSAAREADLARQLLNGTVDGVVLLTGRLPAALAEDGAYRGRTVVISERIDDAAIAGVLIDNEAAAAAAVGHLRALGHRRIAHIAGPPGNVLTAQRRAGYERAIGAACRPIVASGDFTIASGEAAMRQLLRRRTGFTAVFCSNDEMAIGAIRAAKAAGRAVPADLSVCGFDDIAFAGAYDPPLTTIRQPRRAMGREAARLLMALLAGEGDAGRVVTLPFEVVERASSRAI